MKQSVNRIKPQVIQKRTKENLFMDIKVPYRHCKIYLKPFQSDVSYASMQVLLIIVVVHSVEANQSIFDRYLNEINLRYQTAIGQLQVTKLIFYRFVICMRNRKSNHS